MSAAKLAIAELLKHEKAAFAFTARQREEQKPFLFLWLDFVATQVLLGFGKDNVFTELFAVLLKTKLLRSVHRVLRRVINALTRLFTHEPDKFTLFTFFCHIPAILTDGVVEVKAQNIVYCIAGAVSARIAIKAASFVISPASTHAI